MLDESGPTRFVVTHYNGIHLYEGNKFEDVSLRTRVRVLLSRSFPVYRRDARVDDIHDILDWLFDEIPELDVDSEEQKFMVSDAIGEFIGLKMDL